MNKAFFERMKIFSYVVLGLGILGAIIMAFTIIFIKDPLHAYYGAKFSPVGFGITIGSLLCIICLFYILKGISLIGLNSFQDERTEQNQTDESEKPAYFKMSFPKKEPIDLLPQSNNENIDLYNK